MNREGQIDARLPSGTLPFPPLDLLQRTGSMGEDDPVGNYARTGGAVRRQMEAVLPPDWTWKGKRVLDFGCGAGRVLRHFAPEADEAEFWGCEIDRPSVEWMQEKLCPPFQAERILSSSDLPGLPVPDGYFDFIYAWSVYTHITDHWAGWLLEHHRLLADGGLMFATFLGEGAIDYYLGEEWDEDKIGMNAVKIGATWDDGGPMTFISPWWLRTHWGRVFDVLMLIPRGETPGSHGIVLLRRKPVQLSAEDLERIEPNEPREISALQHNLRQLRDECATDARLQEELQEEINRLAWRMQSLYRSTSWKITAPLRDATAWIRGQPARKRA